MTPNVDQLLLQSVHKSNILPLTSSCNVQCVFCSNLQNPHGLETYNISPLSLPKIYDLLEFIDPDKKIVIGESVTRINEGEPLTHPHFEKVIQIIREKFPDTLIQITTNGIRLTEKTVSVLAEAKKVELNVSLNSSCPNNRLKLMMDKTGEWALQGIKLLKKHKVPFHGSIVAMPHITGWNDIYETLSLLEEWGAITTRVFLPGYTKWAQENLRFDDLLWEKIHNFIDDLRANFMMPISCEPPRIQDLRAMVEGIIPGLPAHKAGIKIGDIITSINGEQIISRVDAFDRLQKSGGQVKVSLIRDGQKVDLLLAKSPYERSGIMMSYDIAPDLLKHMVKKAENKGYKRVLVLSSVLGYQVLKKGLKTITKEVEYIIKKVPNRFFGGNIRAGGLLVIEDFISVINEESLNMYDAVFIPQVPFDNWGRDLKGSHYLDLINMIPIAAEIV